MNINDRNEALRFESELDRVKQERNRLRSGLEEKIEEWGACIEYIAVLERALQDILYYQPECTMLNKNLGSCFDCPTCIARKALGDMEDEITVRLGRGEDPRGF